MRLLQWSFFTCIIMLFVFSIGCGSNKPADKDLEEAEKKIEQAYKKSQPPALDEPKNQDSKTQTIEQPQKNTTVSTNVKTPVASKDSTKTEVKKTPETNKKQSDTVKNTEQKQPVKTPQTAQKDQKTTDTTKQTTTSAQKPVTTQKDTETQQKKVETKKTVVSKDSAKKPDERSVEDVVKEKEVYQYKSHNKKDPFINPYASEEKDSSTTQQQRLADTEDVDFSKLNYRGIIQYGNELVAMLEDDAGRGVVLKVGSVIGGAKVESITREMVVLRRFVIKTEGQPREIILHKVTE